MKIDIRQHIAEGDLEAALPALKAAADMAGPDASDTATLLEARLATLRRKAMEDTHEPAALDRERNAITTAALELLSTLPDAPPPPKARPRGLREQAMKQHILLLTLAVKAGVVLWLFTLWQSGGFLYDQFVGVLTLLVPVLAAYTGLMFQDFLDHRHTDAGSPREGPRIRPGVQWAVYAVIVGYGLALGTALGAKAEGLLSYTQLSGFLALIEGGLGVYIARIVRTFFPTDKHKPT